MPSQPQAYQQSADLKKALSSLNKDMEKFGQIKEKHAILSPKEIQSYEKGVRNVGGRVRELRREYRGLGRELAIINQQIQAADKAGDALSAHDLRGQRDKKAGQQRQVGGEHAKAYQVHTKALQAHAKVMQQKQLHEKREAQARRAGHALTSGYQAGRGGLASSARHLWSMRKPGVGGGMAGKMGRFAGPVGMVAGLAAKAGGWVWNQAQQGQQVLARYQAGRSATMALAGRHKNLSRASKGGEAAGYKMAYGPDEAQQIIQQTMRATGNLLLPEIKSNMQLMRGYGMDMGTLGGLQKTARVAGDQDSADVINRALAQSLKVGEFPRALATELAQASTGLVSQLSQGQERVSARAVMGMVAVMSKQLGGVFKGNPQRTAGLIKGVDRFIKNPGGDDMKALNLYGLGYGREKGVDYWEARRRARQGYTPGNLKRMLPQWKKLNTIRKKDGSIDKERSEKAFIDFLASKGVTDDAGAKALARLDTSKLNPKQIKQAMNKTNVDLAKSAKRTTDPLTVRQRQLAQDRGQSDAAQKADKLLTLRVTAINKALGPMATGLEKAGEAADFMGKKISKWFGSKKQPKSAKPGQ